MPIKKEEFDQNGKNPVRDCVRENIIRILNANPKLAFSSIELARMLDARRQTIHQSLRSLESEGLITRRFVEENKRQVCYAKIKEEGVNDEEINEPLVEEVKSEPLVEERDPENEKDDDDDEEVAEVKPKKKGKGKKKKSKK
jgi:DNA-binding HxlR family transcriptional regulator